MLSSFSAVNCIDSKGDGTENSSGSPCDVFIDKKLPIFKQLSAMEGCEEEPLTEQDLQTIIAIESAFYDSPAAQTDASKNRTQFTPRRLLPKSIIQLPDRFSPSYCRDAEKVRYSEIYFRGRIVYSRTETEIEDAARELLHWLDSKKQESGCAVVGFDIEWKPSFKSGVLPGKAAVVQLCADMNRCFVMHIIHSSITPSLRRLLEDPTILKVGVAINNDCVKIFKDYSISVQFVQDLSVLANQKFGGEARNWSLRSLTEKLFFRELPKPSNIRLGNWEVEILSNEQLRYAATDAFISWHLFQILGSL